MCEHIDLKEEEENEKNSEGEEDYGMDKNISQWQRVDYIDDITLICHIIFCWTMFHNKDT